MSRPASCLRVALLGGFVLGCSAPPAASPPVTSGPAPVSTGPSPVAAGVPGGVGPAATTADPAGPSTLGAGPDPVSTLAPAGDGDGVSRITGTDSDVAKPSPAGPELQSALVAFGQRYLAFDYRVNDATRVEQLRPLVTPELYGQLAQPMPAPLLASLAAQQRVVSATFVAVRALDASVYELNFTVLTSTAANGSTPATMIEESRVLLVSVDGNQLVSDVR
jgi:hypothetical protein